MKVFDAIEKALKKCAHPLIGTLRRVLRLCLSRRDRRLLYVIWCSCSRNHHRKSPYPFRHRMFLIEKFALTLMLFKRSVSLIQYIERASDKLRARLTKDVVDRIQTQVTELLVLALLLFLACVLFYPIHRSWLAWLTVYIIIGAINYPLCIIFIDRRRRTWKPQSFNRLMLLLFINYLQIITGFAYLYLNTATIIVTRCANTITRPCDAFYFSLVTITTLGYGDMEPFDAMAKCLVMCEILIGLVFLTLVIATVVSLSIRNRQE